MAAKLGEAKPVGWKSGHEGVPEHWKGIGSGGNAMVWFDGEHAIKRLRPNAGAEPIARFEREATLMVEMARDKALAVVQTDSVRRREGELEIVMELYEGNLDAIIVEFAGKPEKAASALLPIVETLAALAGRENAVHHRDIKPGNLLYRRSGDDIGLVLGDFGCAYLAEDDRLTPANRAIGAWAYRPPEYSIGRVERITEKGDVFGLGKVLWAMLNGERGVVFPGPVWFTDEFDLAKRYPKEPKINRAMIVIAQSCDIREEKRPTLAQLAVSLRNLANETGRSVRGDAPC
jgi:serine/threonine protein kinase